MMLKKALLVATLALCAACGTAKPALKGGETNVLMVVIDTLRADHLSMYGHEFETSPNLDKLAAGGVRFENFYANSSWTRPGMAALLTGRYAREVGIYEERYDKLPPEANTLAERFQERGYLTLGLTSNPNINAWFGFDQGFDTYGDSGRVWGWMAREGAGRPVRPGHADLEVADDVNRRVFELLDHHAADIADKPWYLQVVYIDPHAPYEPPGPYLEQMKAAGARGLTAKYGAEIRYVDDAISKMLAELERRDMLDNTLVVVTSDHGEGLRSYPTVPMSDRHGDTVYEAMVRVPLVLHHPALKAGVVDNLASSIDVIPTVFEMLGWTADEVSGTSVAGWVTGTGHSDHPGYVISESDWQISNKISVRTASHRYIDNLDSRAFQEKGVFEGTRLKAEQRRFLEILPPRELYALRAGQLENPAKNNHIDKDPEAAATAAQILATWQREAPMRTPIARSEQDVFTLGSGEVIRAVAGSEAGSGLPSDMEAALKALGYLDDGMAEEPEDPQKK